jgi:hypothetical protein
MRRMTWFGFVLLLAGCGGPGVGEVVKLRSTAALFYDKDLLDSVAQLKEAGSNREAANFDTVYRERCAVLSRECRVRILKREWNGYKVVVEQSGVDDFKEEGKIGWMQTKDIEQSK